MSNKNTKYADLYPWHCTQDLQNRLIVDAFENGTLDDFKSDEDIWYDTIDELGLFFEKHKRRPLETSMNETEKKLSDWISRQSSYRMRYTPTQEMGETWDAFRTKYILYFQSNEDLWYLRFQELKIFLQENKRKPYLKSKNDHEITISRWLYYQSKNRPLCMHIMSKNEIRDIWDEFKDEYFEYFQSDKKPWSENLEELRAFLCENKRLPHISSENKKERQLRKWIITQKFNRSKCKYSMANRIICEKWDNFKNEHIQYFKSNQEIWLENFKETEEFVNVHKKRPFISSIDPNEQKLGSWLWIQIKKPQTTTGVMANTEIQSMWKKFKDTYPEYFRSTAQIWYDNISRVYKFIALHEKRPTTSSKDKEEQHLGNWLKKQLHHRERNQYLMECEQIRNVWDKFKCDHCKYYA